MVNRICIFEDQHYRRLLPLVYIRPEYELRCGILTLRQKIEKRYPKTPITLHSRTYLAGLLRDENPNTGVNKFNNDGYLFLNGRILAQPDTATMFPIDGSDMLYVDGDTLVAARLNRGAGEILERKVPEALNANSFKGLPITETKVKMLSYPWDLIGNNGSEILSDLALLAPVIGERIKGTLYEGAHLVNRDQIFIGEGTRIKPGVVLDAEGGPIFIGSNATVFPNAVIEGPAFIGDRTLIKAGAKIYEDTSIGEVCKVGGEVEASIIHSYSNKQHDGFLGHAYLGKWVNLGADTNNSDLKNNYGSVKIVIDGKQVDSGSMFMGLIMGDHSKSSINSMFNTGTVVGVSSNVFGSGFPPKFVPSFSWGGSDGMTSYDPERALEVAGRVMARRKIQLSAAERDVLMTVFNLTNDERMSFAQAKKAID